MWEAISYVTGGFTLLAFVAAIGYLGYARYLKYRLGIVQGADTPERQQLIAALSEQFIADIEKVPTSQRAPLIAGELERRHDRARRRERTIWLVVVLSFVAFMVTLLSSSASGLPRPAPLQSLTMLVYGANDYIHRAATRPTAAQLQLDNEIRGVDQIDPSKPTRERQRVLVLALQDPKRVTATTSAFSVGILAEELEKVETDGGTRVVAPNPFEQCTAKLLHSNGQLEPINVSKTETSTGRKCLRFDLPGIQANDDLIVLVRRHEDSRPIFPDGATVQLRPFAQLP